MPVEKWSESVLVVRLGGDPQFTDDIDALEQTLSAERLDAVLDFSAVRYISSSNIARLLQLRRNMAESECRLVLCGVNTQIWSVLLVTGLDKIFEFSSNVTTSLATLQMSSGA